MRIPEFLRSTTVLCLLVLLGALGTGLPSHSHASGETAVNRNSHVVAADHHSHGTQLLEQDERTPSVGPQLVVCSAIDVTLAPAVAALVQSAPTDMLRPMERAPPPGAPRAPPFAA
jgi:hypothetical protein